MIDAQTESIHHMKHSRHIAAAGLLITSLASITPIPAAGDAPPPATANLSGLHDFDFLIGDWRVHHVRIKERLAGCNEWTECDGTCSMRPTMGGWGNVDDNVINVPGEVYRGVGLRARAFRPNFIECPARCAPDEITSVDFGCARY